MAKLRRKNLYTNAGYDTEWVHAVCREYWNAENIIPPSVPRTERSVGGYDLPSQLSDCRWSRVPRKGGSIGGHDRSPMVELPKSYGRRRTIETFMSGLKRTTGNTLSDRLPQAMFTEATFRVVPYALRLDP